MRRHLPDRILVELHAAFGQLFAYERRGEKLEGFLLHHSSGFFAYANVCPHWYVDLDLGFGDFYAADLDRIVCKNHGALFLPQTGECTAGPCAGMFLERFEVTLDGDDALVEVSAPTVIVTTNLENSR